ncbi:3af98dd1-83a2-482c-8322-c5759438051b-CDS [Sclerotinia trifoliorum]|uniref:3af98dd1-83a2-482c-8322-c5759438051b-CDS n=1 Tax=Sclerotinia trifoliorum TaxID=28548 RepID=A0A8H2VUP2_9HELO|nr:3af98dd1-83a2-482c-8322-c5759438051b-CDS [Sclerotinia trifoliorum]
MLQEPRVGTSAKQPLANNPTQGKDPERAYQESPLQAKPERAHSKKAEEHETDESSSYHQPRPTRSRSIHNMSHNIASQSASHFEEASTVQAASGQHRSYSYNSYRSKLDVEQIDTIRLN